MKDFSHAITKPEQLFLALHHAINADATSERVDGLAAELAAIARRSNWTVAGHVHAYAAEWYENALLVLAGYGISGHRLPDESGEVFIVLRQKQAPRAQRVYERVAA